MSSLDAYSREVTHHEFALDTALRTQKLSDDEKETCNCPIPNLLSLVDLIMKEKDFSAPYLDNTLEFTLQDVIKYPVNSETPTHLCLLFNVIDKNGAATVLKNRKRKKRTEIKPDHKDGEGYEFSSHILISLNGYKRVYKAVISRAPKISTNLIELFFNKVLFQIARKNSERFSVNSKTNVTDISTGKTKKILFKPVVGLRGTLDIELFNKMNSGGLAEVTLVKYEKSVINVPDMN
ncbi:TPA: hypothetical protein P1K35_003975, partial [Providencia rettgeri]